MINSRILCLKYQTNGQLQNSRIIGAGRDLWRLSGPTPLHLVQGIQENIQVSLHCLQVSLLPWKKSQVNYMVKKHGSVGK